MQKLSDLLGAAPQSLGQVRSTLIERGEIAKAMQTEEALYVVTVIVPISEVSLDEGKAIIQTKVLARTEQQAIYKAGVQVRRL